MTRSVMRKRFKTEDGRTWTANGYVKRASKDIEAVIVPLMKKLDEQYGMLTKEERKAVAVAILAAKPSIGRTYLKDWLATGVD